jgi:DNA-binding transcriptional regulator YdaS (Cro superfamily)
MQGRAFAKVRGMTTQKDALQRAIKSAGSGIKLAKAIGVSRQAIQQWKRTGVPAVRCADVERATGISRAKLRPDIYL